MNGRQVRFAAVFVAQVRAGHVDHPLLQEGQGLRAVAMGGDQFYTGAQEVAGEHRNARIAAGYQDPVGEIVLVVKELHRGFRSLAGLRSLAGIANQDRIRRR